MPKRKVSIEDKIYDVNLYLDGKESQHRIVSMFDSGLVSVQPWIHNNDSMGTEALTLKGYSDYSVRFVPQIVIIPNHNNQIENISTFNPLESY